MRLFTKNALNVALSANSAAFKTPESLIHEFMTLTRLKIDCIRCSREEGKVNTVEGHE
jgi:hypothetical protein